MLKALDEKVAKAGSSIATFTIASLQFPVDTERLAYNPLVARYCAGRIYMRLLSSMELNSVCGGQQTGTPGSSGGNTGGTGSGSSQGTQGSNPQNPQSDSERQRNERLARLELLQEIEDCQNMFQRYGTGIGGSIGLGLASPTGPGIAAGVFGGMAAGNFVGGLVGDAGCTWIVNRN